jgi:integrase
VKFDLMVGLRRAELAGLSWDDLELDDDHGIMRVRFQLDKHGKRVPVKTAAGERRVELPSVLVELLREHKDAQQTERARLGDAFDEDGLNLVFCKEDGSPYALWWLSKEITELIKSCRFGRERITLHTLLHSASSLARAAGGDSTIRQSILGHASVAINEHYTHPLAGAQRAVLQGAWEIVNPRDQSATKKAS